jgi:hypothetical protein
MGGLFTSSQIQPSACRFTICLVLTSLTVGQPWLFQVYDTKSVTPAPSAFQLGLHCVRGWRPLNSATNYFLSVFQRTHRIGTSVLFNFFLFRSIFYRTPWISLSFVKELTLIVRFYKTSLSIYCWVEIISPFNSQSFCGPTKVFYLIKQKYIKYLR